jgi:uncharacterized protein with HEPN domain
MPLDDHRIHAYFDVDLDVVWSTVTVDLPPLIESLKFALSEMDS